MHEGVEMRNDARGVAATLHANDCGREFRPFLFADSCIAKKKRNTEVNSNGICLFYLLYSTVWNLLGHFLKKNC